MKKFILTPVMLIILGIFFPSPILAQDKADKTVHVSVNGLVCDFCARALEKIFSKEDAVKNINIDLDKKIIEITFIEGKILSDEQIKKLIIDSGYDVRSIHHEVERSDHE